MKHVSQSYTVLTLDKLSRMTRLSWPEYADFDAATYFQWPMLGPYLFGNITPALSPEGCRTMVQLLQALCAKGHIQPGAYVVLVRPCDRKEAYEPETTTA